MFKATSILLLCLSVLAVIAKHEEYDGYGLYEVKVSDIDQIQTMNEIETLLGLDVWSHAVPGSNGMVLVPADRRKKFQEMLEQAEIEYRIDSENIKQQLDLEDERLASAKQRSNRSSSDLPFDTIPRYAEVDAYLLQLARTYPHIVTVESAGTSVQGRDIKYLKISTTNFQDDSKPIVMMESLLHAREWITISATLYAIHKLVTDVNEQEMLQNIDWIVIPIVNPDGYEFTHTNSRFWRKNRATGLTVGNVCVGVDLNRNFDIHWGTASSNSVCSETYHGPRPLSEPEATAVARLIRANWRRIELFLDIHSFGSWILYGYGNGVLPPNGLFLHLVGVRMAQAIDAVKWPSNRNYVVGNVALLLYAASGSAQDFAQSLNVDLSYTYELPAHRNQQNSLNGFLVDPDFIEQAGFETWQGIKAGAGYVLSQNRKKRLGLQN